MVSQSMISVEEARERILSFFSRLEPEEKSILDALGQVLAEDVAAAFDIPPLDNTAMDGYAVRAADTSGASEPHPVRLRVIGELAAGYIFEGEVAPGTAVRIMTGAPIPRGADAIVPFEETDEASTGSASVVACSRRARRRWRCSKPRSPARTSRSAARTSVAAPSCCARARRSARRTSACSRRSAARRARLPPAGRRHPLDGRRAARAGPAAGAGQDLRQQRLRHFGDGARGRRRTKTPRHRRRHDRSAHDETRAPVWTRTCSSRRPASRAATTTS